MKLRTELMYEYFSKCYSCPFIKMIKYSFYIYIYIIHTSGAMDAIKYRRRLSIVWK